MSEIEEREIIKGVAYTYYDKDGIPNVRTVLKTELTDDCIKMIADEVVKRLNDKDEIVRCKNCRYCKETTGYIHDYDCTYFYDIYDGGIYHTSAEDFCSKGVKKDE